MHSLRHSLSFLADYRIGYSPQRPYPWRWTTPLALCLLLTSTVLLACLNIPLSAYDMVQESTYFPNNSVPALPMSNIIPPFLRASDATFAPQTLHVGDTFRLNNSLFSYTIVSAFDAVDNRKPVSSFPYYNNPFSNNCDVTNISATVNRSLAGSVNPSEQYETTASGFVTCTRPTVFQMTWSLPMMNDHLFFPLVGLFGNDLSWALDAVLGGSNEVRGDCSVEVTVRPCCNCTGTIETTPDTTLEMEARNLLQPPCSTEPARFIGLSGILRNTTAAILPFGYDFTWNGSDITNLFAGVKPNEQHGYLGSHNLSALNFPFLNFMQVIYHLVRRDLGVILDNQIYSSPEMFNSSVVVPEGIIYSEGNASRAATSNSTLMAQWRASVLEFNETDRVPVLEYLRPVPRLKPLGPAITSVFVSTFAMVSTVWTIFSFFATAFVPSSEDPSERVATRERFDGPFYHQLEAKRSVEEARSLKDARTDSDDRLDVLFGQLATVIERIDRMENSLRSMQSTMDKPEKTVMKNGDTAGPGISL
ncbi:hypothetical protein DFH06DRAFT_1475795 [Mycena polygramma]|nr:hypothetical protein DFH06DRAFT_1475795 [Mycena polygramma]